MGLLNFFRPKVLPKAPSPIISEALDRARSVHLQGRHAEALAICTEILVNQPDHLEALLAAAEFTASSGDSDRALLIYRKVLDLEPEYAPAYYKSGNLFKDREQLDAALASYDEAIRLDAGYAYALCNRGVVLQRLQRWHAALESYDIALSLTPEDALVHYNRAWVLRELERPVEALASYSQAIALKPDYFEAYCNHGLLLIQLKRWDEALASFSKSIEINPLFALSYFGRGMVQQERKEWTPSLASYDRAIELDPGNASAHFHRGISLMELRQWSSAHASLNQAIALRPDYAEVHYSIAALWAAVGQTDLALANFDKAIALEPNYAEAHLSRGTLLVEMRLFARAIESFDRGLALNGDSSFVLGARCFAKMSICDWSNFTDDVKRLTVGIEAGERVVPPHQALALLNSAALHYKAARIWVERTPNPNPGVSWIARRRQGRVRIGYFSGEFYPHPVSVLMSGVFESHDRSQYEVIAFSYGAHLQDEFGMRLERGVDRFVDVREKSDQGVALLAREMKIDIAVDLAGHTGRGRTGIFAWRAAPLQVNYLGYAGTMAADYMDYLVADATVVPEGQEKHYSEKIVRLPDSFLPPVSGRTIASTIYTRSDLGLPSTGFVFCCFNNSYKITPATFDSWMRILARVPNSVLWLSQSSEIVIKTLRRESLRRGVDEDRLVFASHMASPAEHLARQRAADLFLDTRPYNAHATAIDALCVGLPLLTFPGAGFASRVAASLLKAARLPELIAASEASYENIAVRMAEDPQFLAGIKEKLARRILDSPLFDMSRFVGHLENGYGTMLDRFYAGLTPEHIDVPSGSS